MPTSLQSLIDDSQPLTLKWREAEIELVYRPNVLNRDFHRRQRALPEELKYNAEWAVQWLLGGPPDDKTPKPEPVLASWDVTDDKGKPAPANEKTLAPLATLMLLAMVDAINKDLLPNSPKSETSEGGS